MDNIIEDLERKNMDMSKAMDTIKDRVVWRQHVKASSSARPDGGEQ